MASMWKRTMTYLGLGPDEEYDDYDDDLEPVDGGASHRPMSRYAPPEPPEPPSGAVRTLPRERGPAEPPPSPVRQRSGVVRPIVPQPVNPKPHTVTPTSFNDAQEVADKYKAGVPVIVNTQNIDKDLRRRLVDFASGLSYGLGGQMEKVAEQVYLLTPSDVEVSAEEKRRLQERGF